MLSLSPRKVFDHSGFSELRVNLGNCPIWNGSMEKLFYFYCYIIIFYTIFHLLYKKGPNVVWDIGVPTLHFYLLILVKTQINKVNIKKAKICFQTFLSTYINFYVDLQLIWLTRMKISWKIRRKFHWH